MKRANKRVAIAGGGVAGHRIAFALQHEADVTLIDPKDFFEIPMAVPRLLVEPRRATEAIIPYADFVPKVRHIQGTLASVQPLEYDYLVLATGAAYTNELIKASGGTTAERRACFHDWAARISDARRILIVGGGPVGVELAGEILQDRPGQQLTLIHGGETLLPSLTAVPQRYALQFLRQRGAEVILGQRLTGEHTGKADLVLWCAGNTVTASSVAVDRHLRVAGSTNVFAVGDVTALPEPKLGLWAGKHAAVVIENIRRLLRGDTNLKSYTPATGSRTMLVTLGRNHGTGHLPFGDFTNSWFARTVKSRDMFIGRYRKALNLR